MNDRAATVLVLVAVALAVGYDVTAGRRSDQRLAELVERMRTLQRSQVVVEPTGRDVRPPRAADARPSPATGDGNDGDLKDEEIASELEQTIASNSTGSRRRLAKFIAQAAASPSMGAEKLMAYINGQFEAESIDPAWGPVVERVMRPRIEAAIPQASTLRSFACRSTICRIVVDLSDPTGDAQYEFFGGLVPEKIDNEWNKMCGGLLSSDAERLPDGRKRHRIFLPRTGTWPVPNIVPLDMNDEEEH